MTEHITTPTGTLTVQHAVTAPGHLYVGVKLGDSFKGVYVSTAELLAVIDAEDTDAMRAYLRETAPEVITDLYRPEIPEADSPEDVDEKPATTSSRHYTEADRMGINVLALIDDMHLTADLIASLKRRREDLDLTITRRLDWIAAQLEGMGDRATDMLEYIDRTAQCAHGEDRTR